MKNLRIFSVPLILATFPFSTFAQSGCIRVDSIAKWEVLDSTKTLVYDSQGNSIAFVIFGSSAYLKRTGETFRFFSSTICASDRVQTTSGMDRVIAIEPIRK